MYVCTLLYIYIYFFCIYPPISIHSPNFITLIQFGDTPMHWPAKNGHLKIVKALINSGGNPNATSNVRDHIK